MHKVTVVYRKDWRSYEKFKVGVLDLSKYDFLCCKCYTLPWFYYVEYSHEEGVSVFVFNWNPGETSDVFLCKHCFKKFLSHAKENGVTLDFWKPDGEKTPKT